MDWWNDASWWRHQMETFSALLAICAGNSPVTGEFPAQRPVTRSFDVFFDMCLHKQLSKQSWAWWFETWSRPLWRHNNVTATSYWLNQWILINEVMWLYFTANAPGTILYFHFQNNTFKVTATSPMGQWITGQSCFTSLKASAMGISSGTCFLPSALIGQSYMICLKHVTFKHNNVNFR